MTSMGIVGVVTTVVVVTVLAAVAVVSVLVLAVCRMPLASDGVWLRSGSACGAVPGHGAVLPSPGGCPERHDSGG
jgi:hypothetical protein